MNRDTPGPPTDSSDEPASPDQTAARPLTKDALEVLLAKLEQGEAAHFAGLNLSGHAIRRRDWRDADLTGCRLRDADLSDSDLQDVVGLQAHQLGGAVLSGAKLPLDIAGFQGLDQVAKISGHARNTFLAVIGGCVFSWLTVATAQDAALLMNSSETALPIIQTKVPVAGFFWAAPYILLALYLYLHLYLQRLWDGLAELPAIFPDGRRLDQRAYPWLLIGLASAYVPRLARRRPTAWRLQFVLSLLSAWVLVPFTIALLWARYLPRHDLLGSGVILLALLIATWAGIASFRRCATTLQGRSTTWVSWNPTVEALSCFALVLAASALLSTALAGGPRNAGLARYLYADVNGAVLSGKPAGFQGTREDYGLVLPAKLEGRNLARLQGRSVFLAQARLAGATLDGALLAHADLTGADFEGASLSGAQLGDAKLAGAHFRQARLRGTSLDRADLKGAHFADADLRDASFRGSDLRDSRIRGGRFEGAVFEKAQISGLRFRCNDDGGGCVDLRRARSLSQDQLDRTWRRPRHPSAGGPHHPALSALTPLPHSP